MSDFTKIVVHGGTFHADDVLCVAYAKTLYPDIEVVRTNNPTEVMMNDKQTLVCDVGKEYNPDKCNYDHHNDCPTIGATDIKKSAIGLMLADVDIYSDIETVFRERNKDTSEFATAFCDALTTVQAVDNGIDISSKKFYSLIGRDISDVLYGFNPEWDSDKSLDEAFDEAVSFAVENFVEPSLSLERLPGDKMDVLLSTLYSQKRSAESAKERAQSMLHDSLDNMVQGVVVLPRHCPWEESLIPSEAKFVVFPSNRGGYMLQCVPPELNSFEKKVELPDWNNSENKPDGLTFEHPAKFCAAFDTEAQAVTAAVAVVRENSKTNSKLPSREHDGLNRETDVIDISDGLQNTDVLQK